MSNNGDLSVWVSDLDGYINLNSIRPDYADDGEQYIDEEEQDIADGVVKRHTSWNLHKSREIHLLAGKVISSYTLDRRGIASEEWRWAVHQAEQVLRDLQSWVDIEPVFIRDLLSLGRRYAITRYAKWERITYAAALTATFSHGFTALLDQFMYSEKCLGQPMQRNALQASVRSAFREPNLTAYHRAGMVRSAIHQSADETFGPKGYLQLNREGMRTILSLARLHYSVSEIGVQSLSGLQHLDHLYDHARLEVQRGNDRRPPRQGQRIKNWELRHLHPLTYLYPFSIRNTIARGVKHHEVTSDCPNRGIALNELALARCAIMLMRRQAINDARSR